MQKPGRIIIQTDETQRERQIAPGLWVTRRSFVALCGAGIAAGAFASSAAEIAEPSKQGFEAFLDAANATAARLLDDPSAAGQDRYLRTMSAHTAAIGRVPIPETWRDSGQSDGPGTYIGFNPGGVGFVILHWRMEPGTRILPHAHTYGNVVTVGLEGWVRVRNYEVEGERDYTSDEGFTVRNTVDQILTAGATNLVSLERDYIHGFDAGDEGGRGLDITTRVLPKPDYGVPYLELGEMASSGGPDRRFAARWRRA